MLLHSSGFITRIFPNLLGHALCIIAPARRATPGNLALSVARSLSQARSLFFLALALFSLASAIQ
jgi:hypothetical protein